MEGRSNLLLRELIGGVHEAEEVQAHAAVPGAAKLDRFKF